MAEAVPQVGLLILERRDYLEVRLQSAGTIKEVRQQLQELVDHCKNARPSRVLIDFRESPFIPTTMERFEMGVFGGKLFPYVERAACLARTEQIDPRKFASVVAQNRGLRVDVFDDPTPALSWLLAT